MAPMTGHDKFAQWLSSARSNLRLLQLFGKSLRVTGIANGDRGNRIPTLGNTEQFAGFVDVEPSHLMNDETARGGLHCQLRVGRAEIVESDAIGRVVVLKVPARDRDDEHGSVFGPCGVHVHQNGEHFRIVFVVVLRSD